MSQHDFDIDNATAAAARVDINLALKALGSLSSGTTAPATTYANMLWYETDANWLWVRNEANSAWIRFAYLDQTANKIALVNDTSVVNTSGTQVGLLGDQTTATWQAGTGTTQSLVSPANVKAAILALTSTYTQPTAYGGVGTYVMAGRYASGSPYTFIENTTYAGSALKPAGAAIAVDTMNDGANSVGYPTGGGSTLSGQWRCMGRAVRVSSGTLVTLFLRIS